MARRDYLFMETDSHSVQEGQRRGMQAEIASMDGNRLLNTNMDDLVAYFADKYGIEAPELLEDQMSADQHEAQRDVSGDPNRMAYFRGDRGPVMVTGTTVWPARRNGSRSETAPESVCEMDSVEMRPGSEAGAGPFMNR